MTSRERVLCALNHKEPDRVPIFIGTSGVTTMNTAAYDRLKAYLGIKTETRSFWRGLQYAIMDEADMVRFNSDGRPLFCGPAPSTLERDLGPDRFVDVWGITWQMQPGNHYYDMEERPLKGATIDAIAKHPWPDLAHPSRFAGLREKARRIQEAGYAVVALSGISPFEFSYMLRGMDDWFMDLGADHDFVHALMGKLTFLMRSAVEKLLEEAGDYIDVVITGDDLGSQNTTLISTSMYRELIKPYHVELYQAIKQRTRAKIFYHSDGNIYPFLNDLIEIGVDMINPVHVSAKDMGDTARLKREFGDRLCFNGAIDTQWVLPRGTTEDVRAEVRRRIRDLAPGGGYILSAVHCIQADVPPENVCAMFDEAVKAGRYGSAVPR
jgi:uroporphyrinogen decarboxylase